MCRLRHLFFILLCFPLLLWAKAIDYSVKFKGLCDQAALKKVKAISQLATLKKRPPSSINALRYRAESDRPVMLRMLHSMGYYDAQIEISMDDRPKKVAVLITITPGPLYRIGDFDIEIYSQSKTNPVDCIQLTKDQLGLKKGSAAESERVLFATQRLLLYLSQCGYPLAKVEKRTITVNGKTKQLNGKIVVDAGSLSHFGPVDIEGLTDVYPELIEQKIAWKEGDRYNSALVEQTYQSLMDTQLFGSVLITPDEEDLEQGTLPIRIELAESKHRSLNVGVSYQTFFGPGITFGWEDRNLFNMGRRFTLQGDITKRSHQGYALMLIPDIGEKGQDMIFQAVAFHESIKAYDQQSYYYVNRFEKRVGKRGSFSAGGKIEHVDVSDSVDNGSFMLLEVPLYTRWSWANSLLNPTNGATIEYSTSPTINFTESNSVYWAQKGVFSWYYPFTKSDVFVLAQKLTLESILSDSLGVVPVPKRIFGGSEEDLRGYRYKTVSPLAPDGQPIGGRSAIFYSLETRFRVSSIFGLVPFFDIGNVQENVIPTFSGKWLKSVGLGIRYFSFMGPFRLDIGFPLNRRPGLDPRYRILVSIGQAF